MAQKLHESLICCGFRDEGIMCLGRFSHLGCVTPFTAQEGSCFYASSNQVDWVTAEAACKNDMPGHLIMIKTAEQQKKFENFLDNGKSYK